MTNLIEHNPSSAEAVEAQHEKDKKEYGEIIRDLVDEVTANERMSATEKLEALEIALKAHMHLFLK